MDAHGGHVVCTMPRTAVGVNLGVHLGVIEGRVGPTRTHGGRRGGLGTQADRCRGRVRFAEMVYGRSGPMSYGLTVHSSVVKVVGSFGCVPVSSCLVWTGVQLQVYRTVRQVYPEVYPRCIRIGATARRYSVQRSALRYGEVAPRGARVAAGAGLPGAVRVHTYRSTCSACSCFVYA